MAKKRKPSPAEGRPFVPQEGDELVPAEGEENVFIVRRRDPAIAERMQALHDRELEFYRKQFEATGDGFYLLSGIDLCLRTGRQPPLEPFVQQFCDRFLRFASYQERTLDEAFSVPRRKRFEEAKERHRLMPSVVQQAAALYKAGSSIDGALFETIGKELRISGPQASKLYYAKAILPLRVILGLPVRKTSTKRP